MTYFITKDGQRLPASEAAQNYQKLSKAQLGSFVNLEVSMPILEIPRVICGKCYLLLNRLQNWEIGLMCCY